MNRKKYLPHVLTILGFLAITFIYYSPLLNGKKLRQSDTDNWYGAAKEIIDFSDKTGEQALWTNSMFGGMPAYQISVTYGANLMRYVDKVCTLALPAPANYMFLYLVGFYFLLITMGINQRVAILGAVAFAFSSYFFVSIATGHNTKAHAMAYMAPVVAGIILTYRGRLLAGGIVTAVALALELFTNHVQITYYLMLMMVVYSVVELVMAVRTKTIPAYLKASLVLVIAAFLAVMPNLSSLWATQEYGKYSTRGPSELTLTQDIQTTGLDKDYITDWSYGIGETWTLLVPNFKGGVSDRIGQLNKEALKDVEPNYKQYVANRFTSYFGDQPFTMGPVYVGSIVCLLFLLGVFLVKGPLKWWLLSATALSFMLSWGKYFMWFSDIFLDYVPGYDKFRAVAMTLVIAGFTVPLLATILLDRIVKDPGDFLRDNKKKIIWIAGALLGITLLFCISPSTFTSFSSSKDVEAVTQDVQSQGGDVQVVDTILMNLEAARKSIMVEDSMRTFFFLFLASLLLFGYMRFKFKTDYLIYGLLFLTLIDLWTVGRRYLSNSDFASVKTVANPFPMTAADQYMLQDTSKYRVLNFAVSTFNDASTSYYHQSIGGYHGAKLKRYKELIDSCLTPEMQNIRVAFGQGDTAARMAVASQPALNMLNTKYIVYNPEAAPLANPGALGNAWFVKSVRLVPNADAEIAAINKLNPAEEAVVDERFKEQVSTFHYAADSIATVKMTSYQPNHIVYSYQSSAPQLTVFSEIHYDKGWNAYVDGKEAPYFRANYVLRGMVLPAGKHTVDFKFEPTVFVVGEKISLAGSLILIGLLVYLVFSEVKKLKAAGKTQA